MDSRDTASGPVEREIGLRDARDCLGQLVDEVVYGNQVVFLTKHGRRAAVIMKADSSINKAEATSTKNFVPVPIPGDVKAAATIIDAMLVDDENYDPDPSRYRGVAPSDLVGGFATLIYYLIPKEADLEQIEQEEDQEKIDNLLAQLPLAVSRRLVSGGLDATVVPTIAGAIAAAFCGHHPGEWRNRFANAVTEAEFNAWLYGCWALADIIEVLMAKGAAQNVLFTVADEIDELERERLAAR
ncbi:type II toxin-antitoxin system prevent-host-death family antitoxin [Nonomuraea sp. NPDC004186]